MVLVLLTVVGLEGGALMLMLLRVLVVYDRTKIANQDLRIILNTYIVSLCVGLLV